MYSERTGLRLHLFLSSWICGEVPYLITVVVLGAPLYRCTSARPVRIYFTHLHKFHWFVLTIKQNIFLVIGQFYIFYIKAWINSKNKILFSESKDWSVQSINPSKWMLPPYHVKPSSALPVFKMTAFFLLGLGCSTFCAVWSGSLEAVFGTLELWHV